MLREPRCRRLLVIANPAAGQGRRRRQRLSRCLDLLGGAGCEPILRWTESPGHARHLARAAKDEGVDAVVAAGGDGTINEVANALTGGPLPLGIIPLGTANVLAMELGIGPTAEAAAAAIAGGQCLTISPGLVNGRQFLLMAGVGVDAEVVAGVDLALKRRAGKLAYVAQAVITALRYGYPPLTVSVDSVDHQAYGVVVCNGRHYGGRYIVAPAARLDQEGFAVCLFGRPGPVGSLRAGAALLQGRLSSLPEVTLLPGRHVAITGNTHGAVQADGDLVARLPAEITVAEHKLQVLVPRR